MNRLNLTILLIVVILLGIGTGFIAIELEKQGVFIGIDSEKIGLFIVSVVGILYTYWMSGPWGNRGTRNGEKGTP